MAIKFKFNEEAKNYTDEPRFILDSGAHDPLSRGFSMYYKDGHLHCDVALSNAEWKVSCKSKFTGPLRLPNIIDISYQYLSLRHLMP